MVPILGTGQGAGEYDGYDDHHDGGARPRQSVRRSGGIIPGEASSPTVRERSKAACGPGSQQGGDMDAGMEQETEDGYRNHLGR